MTTEVDQETGVERKEQALETTMADEKKPDEALVSKVIPADEHKLVSTQRGESTIERLAAKIENRRANRIPVTFEIRKLFLKTCREVAKEEGFKNKISVVALQRLRDDYHGRFTAAGDTALADAGKKAFGFWNKDEAMLQILNAGCEYVEEVSSEFFYFRDFNFYHTVIAQRVVLFSSPLMGAFAWLFLFYFFSAVLFCPIMKDDNVCPDRDTFRGWLTSVYFASVTMSTVGYGDVSLVSEDDKWRTFIGTLYMLVAMAVAYTVFSTAADAALGAVQIDGSGQPTSLLLRPFVKEYDPSEMPLYQQIRRMAFLRSLELALWFVILNLIGVFAARLFIRASDELEEDWDWMTTLYWAIQTTTTIGYGDLSMPFDMRWFQIFFTTLGTAFVGAVFGSAASLKSDITDLRRFYAWKRREISKRLIEDIQGPGSDNKVDQFEFLVGSLLMLNKIERSDVEQVMDKFRELAGTKGYIVYSDAAAEGELAADRDDDEDDAIEDEDMNIEIDVGASRF